MSRIGRLPIAVPAGNATGRVCKNCRRNDGTLDVYSKKTA